MYQVVNVRYQTARVEPVHGALVDRGEYRHSPGWPPVEGELSSLGDKLISIAMAHWLIGSHDPNVSSRTYGVRHVQSHHQLEQSVS